MRFTRNGEYGALPALADQERINRAAETVAVAAVEAFAEKMPPLPELDPHEDPSKWTCRVQHVVTFTDKTMGEILDTVTMHEFDIHNKGQRADATIMVPSPIPV